MLKIYNAQYVPLFVWKMAENKQARPLGPCLLKESKLSLL